eukprot:UN25649
MITNELDLKIAELEDIEKDCATQKENHQPSNNYIPRRRTKPTYSNLNTRSMMDSLTTRPVNYASYGNGRTINISPIIDTSVQQRLKQLGKRTQRLNSISFMRERLNSVSHERQALNSINIGTERMIQDGRKRMSKLTGDTYSGRDNRLNSFSSPQERDKAVESSRVRLNSLTINPPTGNLTSRTQRLGSVASIRQQLIELNANTPNVSNNITSK